MNETDKMLEDMLKALEKPQDIQKATEKITSAEIGSLLTDLEKQTSAKDFVFIDCSNEDNLNSFYICKHPVTQKEFEDAMGINPSWFQLNNAKLKVEEIEQLKKEESTENHPVEMVSWYDAIYYCNKRSMIEGLKPAYVINGGPDVKQWKNFYKSWKEYDFWTKIVENPDSNGYRLPNEIEWDYAARGGEEFSYSGSDNIDEVAWYIYNSHKITHPVMKKMPNAYGLYDMSGNVWEWCTDRYSRGGSYDYYNNQCTVFHRIGYDVGTQKNNLGFRVVRNAIN